MGPRTEHTNLLSARSFRLPALATLPYLGVRLYYTHTYNDLDLLSISADLLSMRAFVCTTLVFSISNKSHTNTKFHVCEDSSLGNRSVNLPHILKDNETDLAIQMQSYVLNARARSMLLAHH